MISDYRVIDLVPHSAEMSLLDTIESHSPDGLVAAVTIKENSLFCEAAGMPVWIGIEYMGQAIAAWAGIEARMNNWPVKIGFLVSTRLYESPLSYFPVGETLLVSIEKITDNITGLRVFDCKINIKDIEIQASLTVFMPDNVEHFL